VNPSAHKQMFLGRGRKHQAGIHIDLTIGHNPIGSEGHISVPIPWGSMSRVLSIFGLGDFWIRPDVKSVARGWRKIAGLSERSDFKSSSTVIVFPALNEASLRQSLASLAHKLVGLVQLRSDISCVHGTLFGFERLENAQLSRGEEQLERNCLEQCLVLS
jgi:hypothetical protein